MENIIIEDLFEKYKTILVFKKQKIIFVQSKEDKAYRIANSIIEELPYTKIVDKKRSYIRVYNKINNKKKWGIIDSYGQVIVPLIYDYVSKVYGKDYFKVFTGDAAWDYIEESSGLFDELIDNSGWNGSYYLETLGFGQWGIVSGKNIIVPIVYEWVELISDNHFLCNIGGSRIIKWHDGNIRRNQKAIVDGKWEIRDESKIIVFSGSLEEVMTKFNSIYKSSIKHSVYKQAIGKYNSKK